MTTENKQPYILVNTFTPAGGDLDALVAFQLAEMQATTDEATTHGWLGNKVYRALDGTALIVVTRFRSEQAKDSWAQTDRFKTHIELLEPYVESVHSVPVTLIATHG